MNRRIESVAVLGSGTMGAGIAAVNAKAGCSVLLLDLTLDAAEQGLGRIAQELDDAGAAGRVSVGTFDDDLHKLADVDWIIEVIVENLEIKRNLFTKVEAVRRDGSIVTSNTSGIPLAAIAEGMGGRFEKDVAITHFFNPPQVMKLFELVPGANTEPDVLETLRRYASDRLGKGVVNAKDTPNFIGNRVGCFFLLNGLHRAKPFLADEVTQETIDAVMAKPLGLPATGMYGLLDLIGLDVLHLVGENLAATLPADDLGRAVTSFPSTEQAMFDRGQLGRKSKGGFGRVTKLDDGSKHRETFDLMSETWRDAVAPDVDGIPDELGQVLFADSIQGQIAWELFAPALMYAADLVPEISDDVVNVDRAMRWGFNWEQGPFELLDTVGPARVIERLVAEGKPVPAMLALLERSGSPSFYRNGGQEYLSVDGRWQPVPPAT